jgi:hypothetical protein
MLCWLAEIPLTFINLLVFKECVGKWFINRSIQYLVLLVFFQHSVSTLDLGFVYLMIDFAQTSPETLMESSHI